MASEGQSHFGLTVSFVVSLRGPYISWSFKDWESLRTSGLCVRSSFIQQRAHEGSCNGHIYSEDFHQDEPVSASGKSAGEVAREGRRHMSLWGSAGDWLGRHWRESGWTDGPGSPSNVIRSRMMMTSPNRKVDKGHEPICTHLATICNICLCQTSG